MVIDAHQHFWHYNATKHAWIDDTMAVIRKDFLPADLEQVYNTHGIDGCIAVQADQTLAETDFLVHLAEQHALIKGIVGWVDLRNPKVGMDLDRYKETNIVKGFRHVVQGEPDHNFLLRPAFLDGIAQLQERDFTYDILVFPHQLGAVLEFVKTFPNQLFVIDHMAKPYIKDGYFEGWATMMKAIAAHENVYCKLSGMITEADYHHWSASQISRYMDLILESFGADRCLFGSDWPVCLVAGNYGQVKQLVTDHIATLSDDEQQKIMGLNALKFYL
ncbi:amidohydrolase family protein [Croceivirga sp. JEA036]|uniref:amidohydrolase family protein n=1 Tax=Croceivirga sp. JEA036 TaxID=2721162 RepID=UPI00143A2FC1|nr:amidohydrolase family protein [Croceivirga sp. JEA036]NJB35185.1 amidohydrolase family protein [Croceivirga sp. JEA036]